MINREGTFESLRGGCNPSKGVCNELRRGKPGIGSLACAWLTLLFAAACSLLSALAKSISAPRPGSRHWCSNSRVRVLLCQRRNRGFNSPLNRHGKGRSAARTPACEAGYAGASPVLSPNMPVSWQANDGRGRVRKMLARAFRETPADGRTATVQGSVGEKQYHLPVKQSPSGFAGASPAAPTIGPTSPTGRGACLKSRMLVVQIHCRAHDPRSSKGRTRRFGRWNGGSIPSLGKFAPVAQLAEQQANILFSG